VSMLCVKLFGLVDPIAKTLKVSSAMLTRSLGSQRKDGDNS
jgi:hypothetical protein